MVLYNPSQGMGGTMNVPLLHYPENTHRMDPVFQLHPEN